MSRASDNSSVLLSHYDSLTILPSQYPLAANKDLHSLNKFPEKTAQFHRSTHPIPTQPLAIKAQPKTISIISKKFIATKKYKYKIILIEYSTL